MRRRTGKDPLLSLLRNRSDLMEGKASNYHYHVNLPIRRSLNMCAMNASCSHSLHGAGAIRLQRVSQQSAALWVKEPVPPPDSPGATASKDME